MKYVCGEDFNQCLSVGILVLFFLCFMAGTVFSPSLLGVSNVGNFYDLKRLIVLFFTAAMAFLLFCAPKFKLIAISFRLKVFVALFFAIGLCAACFSSKHLYWSLIELANFFLLFLVFYVFSSLMPLLGRGKLIRYTYFGVLSFSLLFFMKYWLFVAFTLLDGKAFGIQDIVNGFFNVRFFNQLQVLLVPLLFIPFFVSDLAKYKTISFFAISMHWAALLQSEARGAMLALIVSFLLLYVCLNRVNRWPLLKMAAASMSLGMALWLIFIVAIPYWLFNVSALNIRTGSSGRIEIWLYILNVIPTKLWLGFGPMAYAWADLKPLYNAHPHNILMQTLYEYGVSGFVVVLIGVMLLILKCLLAIKRDRLYLGEFAISYSVISAIVYGMFCGVVVMPFAQILFIYVLALNYNITFLKNGNPDDSPQWCRVKLVSILLFLLSAFLLQSYQHNQLHGGHIPRFWINGLLQQ